MGKSSRTTVEQQPVPPTPEESALRAELRDRLLGPENLPASLARFTFLDRLNRINEPAALDPRIASALSVFVPQITAVQNAGGQILSQLIGPGSIPRSENEALSPFLRFGSVLGGSQPSDENRTLGNTLAQRIGSLLSAALSRRLPAVG